jgi:hypothetical protein
MAKPTILTMDWALGMRTDVAANLMPHNAAGNIKNMIPGYGLAPIMIRSGWNKAYTGASDFSAVDATPSRIESLAWAPFPADPSLIAIGNNGAIFRLRPSGVVTELHATGTGGAAAHPPFWHFDRMIIPSQSITVYPWQITYSGTTDTPAAFSGDVPKAKVGASWESYLLLANGGDPSAAYALNPRRIWYSDPGLVTFTMTNNSYIDCPDEVVRIVPMTNGQFVFGYDRCWLISGTVPPNPSTTTPADTVIRELWPQGTCDGRSVCKWGEYIIFANAEGIWKTDGTSCSNVTAAAGVSRGYKGDMINFVTSFSAAGGVMGDWYFLTVLNASRVEQFTWVVNLRDNVAFKFFGFPTLMYASVQSAPTGSNISSPEDLLFGLTTMTNVGRMQPCFDAGGVAGTDANAVVIDWELFSAMYDLGSPVEKRFRRAYFTYNWDNANSGVVKTEYTVTNNPFTGTAGLTTLAQLPTGVGRQPLPVNNRGRWIAFRFSNTTPGTSNVKNFALFGLEVEGHFLESKADVLT